MTDGSSPASAVLKDGNAVYTPGLSERRGSASKFYHSDALGSTRGITDSTQAVTDSQLYDAFGNTVSKTGTTPTPFGFVGKAQYQSDSDSGLQLLGHRYYDPSIGRFLSSDPIQAGANWYAYCDNNPIKEIDPEGLNGFTDGFWRVVHVVLIAITWEKRPEPITIPKPPGITAPGSGPSPPPQPGTGGGGTGGAGGGEPPVEPPASGGSFGGSEPGGISERPPRMGGGSFGGRGTGSGGGLAAPGTIAEGAGVLAQGIQAIAPYAQTTHRIDVDLQDDPCKGEIPQQPYFRPLHLH